MVNSPAAQFVAEVFQCWHCRKLTITAALAEHRKDIPHESLLRKADSQ